MEWDDVFSLTELTASINNLPMRIGNPNDVNLFREVPLTTNSMPVEFYAETSILVPTTEWGGVAPKNPKGKRTAKNWLIPHMPLEDKVLASDLIGVRAFGSTSEMETVGKKVLDTLQSMKNNVDQTLSYRRCKAKQGIILDADGTVLVDYHVDFGVTQNVVDFLLGTDTTDIKAKCQDVIDKVEDGLGQEIYDSIEVEVDRAFYDALKDHKKVKEVYLGWAAAQEKLGQSSKSGFEFCGLKFIVNRQKVGSTPLIAAKTGHAYPVGTQDVFITGLAPADFSETVNTLALPIYAKQEPRKYNRGMDLHVQANQLPACLKPKALVKLVSST